MKKLLDRIFIDGLGGMAQGLFATLIIGTIIQQIGLFMGLSLIHISEPTRHSLISYAVFCLKKFFLMIRRPPRSTHCISSAASDVYKRQDFYIRRAAFNL